MASDLVGVNWFKSSYSNGGGNCIEVADGVPGVIPVRDSKDQHGPALMFSTDEWSSFVTAVKGGEFHR
ncbi:DUF397 domain-containing protein [Streptomyces kasugaensis]|uniref:DUF397 domain-containing protein n=2 Tax=Streptomyces kasugaensis TaxID=1946 RepID=A0A4Q9HX35_STRKA|nr:DUF397 domain-containing protein [Streptomyces kasugaensis]